MHLGLEGLFWSQTFPSAQKLCSKGRLLGCLLFCPQEIRVRQKLGMEVVGLLLFFFFLRISLVFQYWRKLDTSFSTTALLIFLSCGAILCITGCLALTLVSTHQMRGASDPLPYNGDKWKCLQTFPDVPSRARSPLVENYCSGASFSLMFLCNKCSHLCLALISLVHLPNS